MHHVDAYWEYHKIVGDEVGDEVMSPEEYERYKKEVLPERMKNRFYTGWRIEGGMDCKLVGPETKCHCGHRYRQHKTDYPTDKRPIPVPCKACKCKSYQYVPSNGSQEARCTCKHFSSDHDLKMKCNKCACSKLKISLTCGCGNASYLHHTFVETKEERLASGKSIGQDVPFAAMGGLTGFSSLAEGYMRFDPSGARVLPSNQSTEQGRIEELMFPGPQTSTAVIERKGKQKKTR